MAASSSNKDNPIQRDITLEEVEDRKVDLADADEAYRAGPEGLDLSKPEGRQAAPDSGMHPHNK